jgi:hypothetical protein
MSSRNEYHQNAYKNYVDRIQDETITVDHLGQPILQNDIASAVDTFANTYTELL